MSNEAKSTLKRALDKKRARDAAAPPAPETCSECGHRITAHADDAGCIWCGCGHPPDCGCAGCESRRGATEAALRLDLASVVAQRDEAMRKASELPGLSAAFDEVRFALLEAERALVAIRDSRGAPTEIEPWRSKQIAAQEELARVISVATHALSGYSGTGWVSPEKHKADLATLRSQLDALEAQVGAQRAALEATRRELRMCARQLDGLGRHSPPGSSVDRALAAADAALSPDAGRALLDERDRLREERDHWKYRAEKAEWDAAPMDEPLSNAPSSSRDAENNQRWGERRSYLTDDRDQERRNTLTILPGDNGDWYVSVHPENEGDFGRAVRLCTSGGASRAVPGLTIAIAQAYRALAPQPRDVLPSDPAPSSSRDERLERLERFFSDVVAMQARNYGDGIKTHLELITLVAAARAALAPEAGNDTSILEDRIGPASGRLLSAKPIPDAAKGGDK